MTHDNGDALPQGWAWTTLGEVAKVIYRYPTFYGMEHLSLGVPVIRGEHINFDGTLSHNLQDYWYVSQEVSAKFPKTVVELDDLIMSVRGSVGKIARVDERLIGAQVSPNCLRISLNNGLCNSKYVFYYLKSTSGKELISDNINATTIQTIKASAFIQTPLPLPPLNEQRRIVEAIETQFTRLDVGIASLKRLQKALKRYKAAVLKAACEGQLVPQDPNDEPAAELLKRILAERRAKWEADQRAKGKDPAKLKYEAPAAPDTSDLPDLPSGWVWASVEQLNPYNRPCAYGVLQPGLDVEDGVPLIRVGDIDQGKLSLTELKRIDPKIASKYPRTKLRGGEVLLTLVGSIGRTAVVPDVLGGANTARAVGVIPLVDLIYPQWVEIWFRNPSKIVEMISKAHEVARKTLNLEDVRAATVALPPYTEQTHIVEEVDHLLSIADELEQLITQSLRRAERLRQSILKEAFAGRLVAQDPHDEPASALLERVKQGRSKSG